MTTTDFEEWLREQDFNVRYTITEEKYLKYLEDEMGIHKGSLDVAKEIYFEKYDLFTGLGIHSVPRTFTYRGEEFTETRWVITEAPGLWGLESALRIAGERASERGWIDLSTRAADRLAYVEGQEITVRYPWREEE